MNASTWVEQELLQFKEAMGFISQNVSVAIYFSLRHIMQPNFKVKFILTGIHGYKLKHFYIAVSSLVTLISYFQRVQTIRSALGICPACRRQQHYIVVK